MKKLLFPQAPTGLTGAVALAGATQAYGSVVTVTPPANLTISGSHNGAPATDYWDVDGDGTPDFQLTAGTYSGTGIKVGYTGVAGAYQAYDAFGTVNMVVGTYTGALSNGAATYEATNLSTGTLIGSGSSFVYGNYLTTLASRLNTMDTGNFFTKGYLGFEFTAADGIHYGYLGVIATAVTGSKAANDSASLTFFNAAYESTPDMAITIPGGAVPEPGSLAALAFGLAGTAGAVAYSRQKTAAVA